MPDTKLGKSVFWKRGAEACALRGRRFVRPTASLWSCLEPMSGSAARGTGSKVSPAQAH